MYMFIQYRINTYNIYKHYDIKTNINVKFNLMD